MSHPPLPLLPLRDRPKRRLAASRSLAAVALGAVLALGTTGCYHIVMPVRSDRMPTTLVAAIASPRRSVSMINGYDSEVLVWFRTEGAHHIGTDLRDWTDRLLTELRDEFDTRGVTVTIRARDDTKGVEPPDPAALFVRITSIRAPDAAGGGGAEIIASLESQDGSYREQIRSLPDASKLSDALYSLKVLTVESPTLQAWILSSGEP